MRNTNHSLGWIGTGRMGYPMAERLAKAGYNLSVWNRTRAKAEPLAAAGAAIVDRPGELSSADIVFTMVSTGKDLKEVCFGDDGVAAAGNGSAPKILVDCSSVGSDESQDIRDRLAALGTDFIASPVSGNGKAVKAGVLSTVTSGPREAFEIVRPYLETIAPRGVSYVGEGELARFCKIAHNVMLGVVIQNLAEITVLAEKAGVPRHAFLNFINDSVMGSPFTRYKSNAFANLDWTPTFTPGLLLKDIDLGLDSGRELGVPMPVAAAARQAVQHHAGRAARIDPANLERDFGMLLETVADGAGIGLEPENVTIPTGLEDVEE